MKNRYVIISVAKQQRQESAEVYIYRPAANNAVTIYVGLLKFASPVVTDMQCMIVINV